MVEVDGWSLEGGCACGEVRYRMTGRPLFVHCCHCRWCQRESGVAFALNAMIESDRVVLLQGAPEMVSIPTMSGEGQDLVCCPTCRVTLWSHYAGSSEAVCFLRVGSLDDPDRVPPDIHIYTASKQPWVVLPAGDPAVEGDCECEDYWPEEALARRRAYPRHGFGLGARRGSGEPVPGGECPKG
jgi:hypothetical protein